MVLRIEDTDQKRYVEGAEQYILESLEWCGITFDEGVHKGGDYGPYRQSERKDIYRKYAEELIASGHAYYAFDTPEDLEDLRKALEDEKAQNTSYCAASRNRMKNSLTLSEEETRSMISAGEPYVVRFRMPDDEAVKFHDLIRGDVVVSTATLDDKVLFKSDGMPTYHLANIVDDHLMEITHVVRGEEWLPSLPLHILLYRAFGWEAPQFGHMPLTLKPDGKGKLSKRDGDRLGFPVFPLEWKNPQTGEVSSGYRESGYFPEAFINILAFLGWNPGTEQEIFSMEELVEVFTIERVGKSGSRFDPEKAKWYNHQYLVQKSDPELAGMFQPTLNEKGLNFPDAFVAKVIALVKERVNFISDIWEQAWYFFEAPAEYDEKMVRKRWKENTPDILRRFTREMKMVDPFTSGAIHDRVNQFLEANELGMGQVMPLVRLALVGSGTGPGVTDMMEVFGKKESLERIQKAITTIN
jgi:glutamyl-tRNA synthetase